MAFTKNPKGPDLEKCRATQRRYRLAHREQDRARGKAYRKANPEKVAAYRLKIKDKLVVYRRRYRANQAQKLREGDLRRLYNLTPELLARLLAHQGNRCAICGHQFDGVKPFGIPQVDHKHGGDVRGVLCSRCNRALGGFQDDPAILLAAVEYLGNPPATSFLTPQLALFEEAG